MSLNTCSRLGPWACEAYIALRPYAEGWSPDAAAPVQHCNTHTTRAAKHKGVKIMQHEKSITSCTDVYTADTL